LKNAEFKVNWRAVSCRKPGVGRHMRGIMRCDSANKRGICYLYKDASKYCQRH